VDRTHLDRIRSFGPCGPIFLAADERRLDRHGAARIVRRVCLAFCSALTTHHVGEDDGMFRALLDARPYLAPTIQNLIDDHAAIAAILLQVRALATQAKTIPAESLPRLRRELDGLPAIARPTGLCQCRPLRSSSGRPDGRETP
jgi:hypothetical protein